MPKKYYGEVLGKFFGGSSIRFNSSCHNPLFPVAYLHGW